MNIDFELLSKKMIGQTVPKPSSGTLSGHAAGEPFDKLVYKFLKEQLPQNTFRQYEFLNELFLANPQVQNYNERVKLIGTPTISYLLSRGKEPTNKWKPDKLFEEKQNDTADIVVSDKDFIHIIDVKTRNMSKDAQAPNIISASKLAGACSVMLDNNDFDSFDINYIQVDWILEDKNLVCTNITKADLFKSNPEKLYINWASAMQIQFHVNELNQNYNGDKKNWAKEYLYHFTQEATKRSKYMINEYVIPYEKYTKSVV